MKKNTFRVIVASLLVASMALPLFACTQGDDTTETDPETNTSAPEIEAIDPATLGEASITYVCDDGSILSTYNGKTAADFGGVCAYYEKEGYSVYSSHDMGGNLASTYVKGAAMAHVYHHPSNGELNIVLSETAGDTLPPATPAVTDGDYACTVVQMMDAAHVNGMGYIIQLKDGSYIVYDGAYTEQAGKMEAYMLENHKGEGKPIIRAWVLTHSHNDHYPAFQTFSKKSKEKFIVEHIIVSPMNDANYFMNDPNDRDPYLSTKFSKDAARFAGAKVVFAHTGMRFTFCNLDMEILYAPESYYKTTSDLGNFNNTSIVSRLYDKDYSALFTGDVGIQGTNLMEKYYGDYLKSDMCQISHHGVEDVPLSFYEYVKAPILFYPCDLWLYNQTERHWEERKAMEGWDCTKEILIQGLGQYVRAWGTTFEADAPLSMPDYPISAPEEDTEAETPENDPSRLQTDKTTYKVGEPILVTAVGGGTDWVGIAPVGALSSERWWYVTTVGSGTQFDLLSTVTSEGKSGNLAAGEYFIALVPNDQPWASEGYTASVTITITE